ncbi:MAG TPA: S49 family peptidase, partial [Pyrinomonadaceae bacterium]|nr:S49 family peptidase [Pyrinomonadaceae bacterium]
MAMSKTGKTILIVGGILFALVLVAIIGLALLIESSGRPTVSSNSVLVLNVSGELPDYSYEDPTARIFGFRQPQSFTSLLTQLRKAKVDSRVSAVLLEVQFPQIGWGKADELRDAIADFKQSGKPVYAYMEIGSNKEYYIASVADKVFLPPTGDLYVNGFAANVMFYRGTLDKIGVEPEFIQIGPKYKNAPDQYLRKDMGDGHREVMNSILDSYYNRYAQTIADARKKTPEDVKALIDNAPYNAVKAKELGLIDGTLYREQVDEELKKQLGYKETEKLRSIGNGEYREIRADELGLNNGQKVAVIYASGAIVGGRSNQGTFGGTQTTGSDTVVDAINDAAADDSIKAIAQQFPNLNRFVMKGSARTSGSSDISIGYNIPQGSVTVTAGGQTLAEGVDYEINYDLGTIKVINQAILNAGLPVQVNFENNAAFGIQQRNYLGLRLDYLTKNTLKE